VLDESAQRRIAFRDEVGMTSCIDFRAVAEELLVAHPTSNLYFLLDHAGLPGLHRQLLRTSAKWASLFDNTKEANALAVAPILVLATSEGRLQMSRSLFKWIGENGTYTSTVTMLSSPLGLEPLKSRLAARLNVRLSEDMEAMLRFFDPRVLEGLIKILSAEQAKEFFSPASAWRYVDRTGNLVEIATNFHIQEILSTPLVLSQQQEFALIDASEIDQVIDLLRSNLPKLTAALPLSELYGFVSQKLTQSRQDGIDSILKSTLYIAALLSEGEILPEDNHERTSCIS
jgi:hypothetical protein